MTRPLALIFYERLLPGSQLVNRLQDLGYRVQAVPVADLLTAEAEKEKPLLVFADLQTTGRNQPLAAVAALKKNAATAHLPVVTFASEAQEELQTEAVQAGAIAVGDIALLNHLPQLLDQALQLD